MMYPLLLVDRSCCQINMWDLGLGSWGGGGGGGGGGGVSSGQIV